MNRQNDIFLWSSSTAIYPRLLAKSIDLILIIAIFFLGRAFWPPLGSLLAGTFCAIQDGMGVGQSVGKRIIGLQVIEESSGFACSMGASVMRNGAFALLFLMSLQKFLLIISILFVIPLVFFELILILTLDSRVRLGDVIANTSVVEYSDGMSRLEIG